MTKLSNSLYGFALLACITSTCYAELPVIDVNEIIQTGQVFSKLHDELTELTNQYQALQRQYQTITGHYGWGTFQNSLTQLKQVHEWAPATWQNALNGMAGGNPARYQQLLTEYKQNHRVLTSSQYQKGRDAGLAKSYANQIKTNQTSATQANYEFNQINQHLQALYKLSDAIESDRSNNLKSSIDLNSRIEVETGYIAIEELRMQTLLNEQAASQTASRINQETETAEFNQAGENP